ncbi:autoinducer binding domain-containing protein [Trinickia caryophylli]|uniref:LuxR family transcriptional regulator n=1 Tax=Trinickia caryophylli TaxID=28094 RepID=A0A1X7DWM5_TRICW|nr:autoinducer binding domain-containing protein [Trinickia caryophylli]PMS14224.1 LuxR family transcriptional regulator [Trinickia caryophylli]TRX17923.1 LuxR family transcriptional regulator [Trinickia caryophylli]WQE11302.1 autoinducer binding domain-containing protein [Trinickia caryophylli]SMF23016.1 LuxR family transcriptional regulator [Trinickia caryophylli]GLU32453.1 LuxR family transcriptional regulator [Trinickia caryophylli]
MRSWAEELVGEFNETDSDAQVFAKIESAANHLGFEYCAYALRAPWPLSKPKTRLVNNYPEWWQRRYEEARYIEIDPTVRHARRSRTPVIWSDALFAEAPQLWREARSVGLRVGWAQSAFDSCGVAGMLTLARSDGPLTADELTEKEARMRWLVNTAHLALKRVLMPKLMDDPERGLTEREIEVLKWAADGKTSGEISKILVISVDTVNFHVKNAVTKLKSANKTAAVVRAAMLGLLH